ENNALVPAQGRSPQKTTRAALQKIKKEDKLCWESNSPDESAEKSRREAVMRKWFPAVVVLALVAVNATSTRAQDEITFLAPGIMQEPIQELIKGFEAKTGHKVKATFGGEDSTKQQIIKGEAFDVPALESTGKTPLSDVIASGNVVAGSATPIAKIPVGVAVKKGAPK